MSFNGGGGGSSQISTAQDVALNNPANGQSLVYNSTISKWQNVSISAGSVTAASITDATTIGRTILTAVDVTAVKLALTLTKLDVGLANVDNTNDIGKPISTATQVALNTKANTSSLAAVATSGSYNDLTDISSVETLTHASTTYVPLLDVLASTTTAKPLTVKRIQPFDATAGAIVVSTLPALSSLSFGARFGVSKVDTGPNTITIPFTSGDTTATGSSSIVLALQGTVELQVVTNPTGGKFWRSVNHVRSDSVLQTVDPSYDPTNAVVLTATSVKSALTQLDAMAVDSASITGAITQMRSDITSNASNITTNSNGIQTQSGQILTIQQQLTTIPTIVTHGSDATVVRPMGTPGPVIWIGSVTPNNCKTGDLLMSATVLTSQVPVPSDIQNFVMTAGDGSASLSWSAANDNGVTDHYEIQIGTTSPPSGTPTLGTSPMTVSGLTNGTSYYARVRGVSSTGTIGNWTVVLAAAPLAAGGASEVTSGLLNKWLTISLTGQTNGNNLNGTWADQVAGLTLGGTAGVQFKPVYVTNAIGGNKPVLRFVSASQHRLTEGSNQARTVGTRILVAKLNALPATAAGYTLVGGSGSTKQLLQITQAGVFQIDGGAVLSSGVTLDTTNWHTFAARFNGTSSAVQVDATIVNGNAGTAAATGTQLGGRGSASDWSSMDIAALVDYNRILTDAEVAQETAWLRNQLGY